MKSIALVVALAPVVVAQTSCAFSDLTALGPIQSCPWQATCFRASVLGQPINHPQAQPPYSWVGGLTLNGREFALHAASNGIAIIDTHDLAATPPGTTPPSFWSSFQADLPGYSGPWDFWRGVVSYKSLIVECMPFRPYLRVFQLVLSTKGYVVNPLPPIPIGPPSPIYTAYRLNVDPETGMLFVCGCPPTAATGGYRPMLAFDLDSYLTTATPPPVHWTFFGPPGIGMDTFDAHVVKYGATKRLVVSDYLGGRAVIVDITGLDSAAPGTFAVTNWVMPDFTPCHSVWVDPTRSRLYRSFDDAYVDVHDLSGLNYSANAVVTLPLAMTQYWQSPQALSYYGAGSFHVIEGLGMTGYGAGWDGGLMLFDLRPDALTPHSVLARVDTCATDSCYSAAGLYHGAWCVHRTQDSGVIYVSDVSQGLFLVRAEVAHLNRFGNGTSSSLHPTIPQLSLEHGPPRVTRPQAPIPIAPFTAVPELDGSFKLTVSNLTGSATAQRVLVVDVALTPTTTDFFDPPTNSQPRYGALPTRVSQFADVTGLPVTTVDISLAGANEGLRLFLQAAVYELVGGSPQLVATSRGSFVGVAAQRN